MKEDYTDIIQQVSQVVFEAIKDREENLSESVKELDSELAKLLRLIGREVMSKCLNEAAEKVTNESKKTRTVKLARGAYFQEKPSNLEDGDESEVVQSD